MGRGDLVASLVLIFPLYLAYAVGILSWGAVNGVDFVSRHVWAACGYDRHTYLLAHAIIAVAFLLWVKRSRRAGTLSTEVVVPLVLEAAVYAVTMGALIRLLMGPIEGALAVADGGLGSPGARVVASLGAGIHEELVFRLGGVAGGAWLLIRVGLAPRTAIPVAVAVSSVLFAYAHHVGPMGEPFDADVFVFRCLAGLVFAGIFWFRSLAHAVYAHAMYDVWVLVIVA
jgi:hypothetical protein